MAITIEQLKIKAKTPEKVTMRDIADYVGVSRTAVSFVLNKKARQMGVSPKLERKIIKAAQKLNYRPSLFAKGLRSQKSMLIGIILPHTTIPYAPALLRDIESQARECDYQIMLGQHNENSETLEEILERFLGSYIAGLIIVPTLKMKELAIYQELKQKKFPMVFVERGLEDNDIHVVNFDVERSIKIAVNYLHSLGHSKIALYDAPTELAESKHREYAYRVTLENLSLPYYSHFIRTSSLFEQLDEQEEHIREDLKKLMANEVKPTAIIAVGATRAIAIYQAAISLGYRIPEDLSLIAITGLEFTGFHRARITTVKSSYENVGFVAFKMLFDLINNPDLPAQRILLTPTFIEGETTAKCIKD